MSEEGPIYTGNGWSKYQMYVLKQLDDHNKILEKLVDRLSNITMQLEVRQREMDTIREEFREINDSLEKLTEEDKKMEKQLQGHEIDKTVATKTKAIWMGIGGMVIGGITLLLQWLGQILKLIN